MMTKSEYYKRLREIAKAEHRCIQCGKQDAYTLNGRSRCSVCADKGKIADRKRADTHWSYEAQKEVREKRAAKGLCVRCGRIAPPGRRTCQLCTFNTNRNLRNAKIAAGMNWPRGSNGICWTCNKEPVLSGKKLCRSCYENTLAAQSKCTEWHKENGWGPVKQSVDNFWKLEHAEREERKANKKQRPSEEARGSLHP